MYDKHKDDTLGFVKVTPVIISCSWRLLSGVIHCTSEELLVLMVRGLFLKLAFLYAQFACVNMSLYDLRFADTVWEVLSQLERQGIHVSALYL